MDRDPADRMSCVVCGIETKRHTGWFLVMDNCWLDRVKVMSWHPALAGTGRARAVCGKMHLKALLTHWLNYANLQLAATGGPLPMSFDGSPASNYINASLGRVVGELAVEREPQSPGWTGSPEAMECILDLLIGETEIRSGTLQLTPLERLVGGPRYYPFPLT